MNDKKNIDRFFQDKFNDFEANPKEQVWKNIQTGLKKKKKQRKVIPFWVKSSGIAAAFLLGLFALNVVFKTNVPLKNTIVLEPEILNNSSQSKDSIPNAMDKNTDFFQIKKNTEIVVTKSKTRNTDVKKIESPHMSEANSNKKTRLNKSTATHLQENHSSKPLTTAANDNAGFQTGLAEQNTTRSANLLQDIQNQTPKNEVLNKKEPSEIVTIESKKQQSIASATPNELEEILKNKEEEKETLVHHQKNKWQIMPNIATVYLNSDSGGSAIDPQFSENQKTADNTLSFGVGVQYAISKKIALRSGINKLSLGYNTNNVIYSAGLSANNLANISYTTTEPIKVQNEAVFNSLLSFEKDLQQTNSGSLNQKMGYYEVPLELSYTVLDKKFGINIIGGVSTLFLQQNSISLISSETNVKLGEANNLSQIHFSTNVGLGFKYQIVKSFQINFEPMVKYQMNTYSNNSSDFKPLFIGLYSGFSYSF